MPELPEVETIVRDLRSLVTGACILECRLRFPSVVRYPEPSLFAERARGRVIESLTRRGKYIVMRLDSGDLLVIHLGMTGRVLVLAPATPLDKHDHAVFPLADGRELRYRDIRRFGRLLLGTEEELHDSRHLPRLGPEPLEPDFTPQDLHSRLHRRRAPLKALLLDQSLIAGVGNIYADESLFRARLRPDRAGARVGAASAVRLHAALRESLLAGIANRGTSVDDYVDANGQQGTNQHRLLVYGRGGEPCFNCATPLRVKRIGGRTTVYCPHCQH